MSAEPQAAAEEVVSLFSGIGGLDKGLQDAGFRIRSHAEIVPFRRRVLEVRFPGVPCHEDVKEVPNADGATLLCGGFPCQDLSVAGRRAGLKGERSSLFWEVVRVISASAVRPRFVLLENVPGLLSSCSCRGCRKCGVLLRWHRRRGCQGSPGCPACSAAERIRRRHAGTDAAMVFAALGNLGYRVSYRVLDSRHFGVPQRRRRVFILAERDPGGEGAPEVLPEPSGGEGDPLAVGEPWPGAARAAAQGAEGSGVEGFGGGGAADVDVASPLGRFGDTGGHRQDFDSAGAYVVEPEEEAATLKAQRGDGGGGIGPEETLVPGTYFEGALGDIEEDDHSGSLMARDLKGEAGRTHVVEPQQEGFVEVDHGGYHAEDAAGTLQERDGTAQPIRTVVAVPDEAATLTRGSSSEGVSEPGRRQEDDLNLVAEVEPDEAMSFSLRGREGGAQPEVNEGEVDALRSSEGGSSRDYVVAEGEVSDAASFLAGSGEKARGIGYEEEVAPTLGSEPNGNQRTPTVVYTKGHSAGDSHTDPELWREDDQAKTLHTMGHQPTLVVEGDEDSEIGGGRGPDPAATSGAAGEADPGAGAAPEAIGFHATQDPVSEDGATPALGKGSSAGTGSLGVVTEEDEDEVTAFAWQQGDDSGATGTGRGRSWVARAGDYSGALAKQRHDAVQYRDVVRRLTPTECERLQGLPDGWTKLDDSTPDGPRYAALGDAVTTAPAWWIGRRILAKIAWLEDRGRGRIGAGSPGETLVLVPPGDPAPEDTASTLKAQDGRGWSYDPEATYVVEADAEPE